MVQETSEPGTIERGPDEGGGDQDRPAPLPQVPTSVRRVPIDRLLSVVVLSPAQASLLAVRLLDAIAVRHAHGTSDPQHPVGPRWAASLTSSGEVEVGYAEPGEGSCVTDLLEELSQNARRLPAHPRPEQLVLLRSLEETAAAERLEPGERARELERSVVEVLGPGAVQRLSGQLAALVRALARMAPHVVPRVAPRVAPVVAAASVPVPPLDAPAGSRPGVPRSAHPRPGPRLPPRRRRALRPRHTRARRTALVVLLLAVALAGSGYVVLRDTETTGPGGAPGRSDQRAAPTATEGASTHPSKQRRPRPRPEVAALAGRTAAAVTGVEVQRNGTCTPGAPCPVTVTVRLSPATAARPVTWRVGTVRSCASDVTWSPPISVTAQPGWTSVYASTSVPAPEGRSPALVALTSAPARAQSPPVPVVGPSLRC